ncbi:vancomycin resistance histidine kinase VanS [Clostridium oryzae]|uniref:histidine kinase n=1 Tax=Clostridium oryzae TaxID=1450648 RepID=A0A1V4IUW3_9CLOT|nr:sensor histidine kinase YycG [Clostridium oryzae]
MFLWVILILIIAFIIGSFLMNFFVDGIFQDAFAKTFVSICERVLKFNFDQSAALYQFIFQQHKYQWVSIGFLIMLLIIFYCVLSRFTSYFNEISLGMDKLLEESDKDIELSPEMDFMEKRLNKVKNSLEKRSKDAQEAEQRKNDLVVYLAHDIKTPLTSVVGYLSLLDEASDMPQQQREKYTKITLEKAYKLEQLINEFFEITRYNLQSIILDKSEINLNYMLLQMADEFYPMLEPKGKQAVVKAEEDITLCGDADKLARVFNNILKNAIAYSYDNSVIQIEAVKKGEDVIIIFTNHGRTIPAQKLDTIFEKFYRLDSSRTSSTGGAGLGLAIAREIVNAHGGSISADSSDEKTVFTVVLPNKK